MLLLMQQLRAGLHMNGEKQHGNYDPYGHPARD
jgi:hypothetical protein